MAAIGNDISVETGALENGVLNCYGRCVFRWRNEALNARRRVMVR